MGWAGEFLRIFLFPATLRFSFNFVDTDAGLHLSGTTTAAAPTLVGAMLFMGGLGLIIAGILEWVLGK